MIVDPVIPVIEIFDVISGEETIDPILILPETAPISIELAEIIATTVLEPLLRLKLDLSDAKTL